MSEKNISWFHCGHCGSLFESTSGNGIERICPACGRNPVPEPDPASNESGGFAAALPVTAMQSSGEHQEHSRRRGRSDYFTLKLTVAVLLFTVALVLGARWLGSASLENNLPRVDSGREIDAVSASDIAFLSAAMPTCGEILYQFLRAETAVQKGQFVLNSRKRAARMEQFYQLNAIEGISPTAISITHRAVIHSPAGRLIAANWTSNEGHVFDTVFAQEDGEWRLDWDHFARVSDYPWSLFLAGSGEDLGEFRLLARERLADERKGAANISLTFCAPRFGHSGEVGYESPEFLVPRDSPNGRLLQQAFELNRSGKLPFDAKLSNIDPEEFIRVRVKIRRIEKGGERRFIIEGPVTCHWFSAGDDSLQMPGQAVEE